MDLNVYKELKQLIEAMTCTGAPSLDQGHIKRVKQICKSSNAYVERAFDLLMVQLGKPHSEIRLSAFQITNELFIRSHIFRELLISRFQQLLELTIETDSDQPLPPPYPAASQLKQQTLLAIRQWNDKFGPSYPKLRLGYEFLKFNRKVDFDNLVAQSDGQRRRQEEKEMRAKLLLEQQLQTVQKEINDMSPDIQQCLTETEACFNLLLPRMDTFSSDYFDVPNITHSHDNHDDDSHDNHDDDSHDNHDNDSHDNHDNNSHDNHHDDSHSNHDDDSCSNHDNDSAQSDSEEEDWVEVEGPSSSSFSELEGHGITGREFNLTITLPQGKNTLLMEETEDNQSIFESLRGCRILCESTYLPAVNRWLQLLTKYGGEDKLKQVIELKQKLLQAKEKYEELKIVPFVKKSSGDNTMTTLKGKSSTSKNAPVKFSMEVSGKKKDTSSTLSLDPTSMEAQLSIMKQKQRSSVESLVTASDTKKNAPKNVVTAHKAALLSQAPVLPFDTDLYEWDNPNSIPNEIHFESLHKFWAGAKETEVVISEERKAIMSNRKITFEGTFQPVKWSCRAPLPNGKLCPRRDRVKCPFHGLIIARDEQGQPINDNSALADSTQSTPTAAAPVDELSWEDIEEEVSMATGELKWKHQKKSRKRKENPMGTLTDIKSKKISVRARLEKKILNKRSLTRVADAMDKISERQHQQKFASSFKYALSK